MILGTSGNVHDLKKTLGFGHTRLFKIISEKTNHFAKYQNLKNRKCWQDVFQQSENLEFGVLEIRNLKQLLENIQLVDY